MNTINNSKRVKIASIVGGLFLVIALAIGLTLGTSSFVTTTAYASESHEVAVREGNFSITNLSENIALSDATLEDNFCDSSIVIILNPNISNFRGVSRQLNDLLIEEIGAIAITDESALPTHFVNRDGSINRVNAPTLAEHFESSSFKQFLQVRLNRNCRQNVLDVVRRVERINGVVYVGVERFATFATAPSATPNDPRFINGDQWALDGSFGIHAPAAWGITTGSRNIRVGVIDSGFSPHEDLNPEGNSNVVAGWNWVDNNDNYTDINGHGTNSASIIGAVGNNGIGVTGVAQRVSIVPMKVGDVIVSTNAVRNAIFHARDLWDTSQRISILNYSGFGFGRETNILGAVTQFPGLFSWSAGNNNFNVDNYSSVIHFDVPNLISVGARNEYGNRGWHDSEGRNDSNFGRAVNIFAPSGSLAATIHNGYNLYGGTSAAAPHVSGATKRH